MNLNVDHTFVVHVSEGAEDREKSVSEQLNRRNIPFEFMLRGDLKDITPEIQQEYFSDYLLGDLIPGTSCSLKHIYILEEIVKRKLDRVLILEDDIFLDKNFVSICNKALEETTDESRNFPPNYFLALENNRKFVPKTEEVEGRHLYEEDRVRFGGAYVVTYGTAEAILNYIKEFKCNMIIDSLYTVICREGLFSIYWIHPPIAEQGSHNGKFKSLLDEKRHGLFQRLNWKVQTAFKGKIRRRFK